MAIEPEWAQMSNEEVREVLLQLVKPIFMDINRLERMKRDLEIIVEDYNTSKSPEGLLFSVSRTVRRQRLWNRFSSGLRECFCSS